MYELKKVGNKTYYIDSPSKIGIYMVSNKDIYLIDSGNDKEAAKKAYKIIEENNWNLIGIINTHSNADHIGGNAYLQGKTNCKIISTGLENTLTKYPILETSFLYGGFPLNELKNKFLYADKSNPTDELLYIDGLEYISLKGHFFDMIGIKTDDDVIFVADSVFDEDLINKYHVAFIYDVKEFLNTLDKLEQMNSKLFIPSHGRVVTDIKELTNLNRNKINEIIDLLLDICINPICFDDILQNISNKYDLKMNTNQYVLVGSTIKSYLSYLKNDNKLDVIFENNRMYWVKI